MDASRYLEAISHRLAAYHEIAPDYTWKGINYDLYAHFFQRNERYIATKKTVIYGIEANRHLFLKVDSNIRTNEVFFRIDHLTSSLKELVKPHDEHMSSLLEIVFITEGPVSKDLIETIEKIKFYKSFFFGLQGWVHLGILLVDLSDHKIYSNQKGREDITLFSVPSKPIE